VSNFENLFSFQFSFRYDNSVLEFLECTDTDAIPSYSCSDIIPEEDEPIFRSLWFEPMNNLTTLEDGTQLAQLCFMVFAEPDDGQMLLQFTDDLVGEATKGDPNDVRVTNKFPFCDQENLTSNNYDITDNNSLTIYPNPAIDVLYVENNDVNLTAERISIYDTTGQLIIKEKHTKQLNKINLDRLQQGQYFIRIDMNNQTSYSSRFFKQ